MVLWIDSHVTGGHGRSMDVGRRGGGALAREGGRVIGGATIVVGLLSVTGLMVIS
jgi:hypothetical protein